MARFGAFGKGCSGGGNSGNQISTDQFTFGFKHEYGRDRGRGHGGRFSGKEKSPYKPTKPDPRLELPMPESIYHHQLIKQKLEPGTVGTPIELISNFYKLITSNRIIYRYHLAIVNTKKKKPKENKEGKKRDFTPTADQRNEQIVKQNKIVTKFIEDNSNLFLNVTYAFDVWKQSLCSTKPLNLSSNEFYQKIQLNGKNCEYKITLRLIESVDLSAASAFYRGEAKSIDRQVQLVLETVLRHAMAKSFDIYSWNFFDFNTTEPSNLFKFNFHEFIRGFMANIRKTEFGLALNLHLKTECIFSKTYTKLVHFVSDIAKVGKLEYVTLEEWQMRQVNNTIRGLKIYVSNDPEIVYYVDRIVENKPQNCKYLIKNKLIEKFGSNLKTYPLVKIRMGQEFYLPMEFCFLVDKQIMRRKHPLVKQEFIDRQAVPPNIYFNTVNEFVSKIVEQQESTINEFGLQLMGKPTAIKGRVLPAPKAINSDEPNALYVKIKPPKQWNLICFDNNISIEEVSFFVVAMRAAAIELELNFGEAHNIKIESIDCVQDAQAIFEQTMQQVHIELFFFVIPRRHASIPKTDDLYKLLIHLCDQRGTVSQCIDSKKIKKTPPGYFKDFLCKVNTKLGGQNNVFKEETLSKLPFNPSRTMIVGSRVCTPNLGQRSAIAALTGSHDALLTKYSASIRLVQKNTEIIHEIESMLDELLHEYYRYNGHYPENVIFFRSAVSQPKLTNLRKMEMLRILQSLYKTGRIIKLTLILVQKNTQARFALPQPESPTGTPNYQVPSGTVVDQYVVDPMSREFYLVSQFTDCGTSRPTKYIVLRDDLRLNTDQLQQSTFYLCHNYSLSQKVIGEPIAVRYAEQCAKGTIQQIDTRLGVLSRLDQSQTNAQANDYSTSQLEQAIVTKLNSLVKTDDRIKNLLYYC